MLCVCEDDLGLSTAVSWPDRECCVSVDARVRLIGKAVAFTVALAIAAPLIIMAWLEERLLRGEVLFQLSSQLLAVVPGVPRRGLRGAFHFRKHESCSWGAHMCL